MPKPDRIELDFLADLQALAQRGPRTSASLLLFAIILFFVSAVFWANHASLDQVTRGTGKVIPSGDIQIVQNLEGGILSEILVHEGDLVTKGDTLLRIDDTRLAGKYRENYAEYLALQIEITRLQSEIDGTLPVFTKAMKNQTATTLANEMALYHARQQEFNSALAILKQKAEQRQQDLIELEHRIAPLKQSLEFAQEELAITEPMYKKGVTSKIELLRVMRQVNDLELKLQSARLLIPKAQSALVEAKRKTVEIKEKFRAAAQTMLNKSQRRFAVVNEILPALEDRVSRTEVRAPVTGVINRVWVNTLGGVIKSGMPLVEIVPKEKNLLVEIRIIPSDIAFVSPNQTAQVKITAYDFAVYGALTAKLVHISADTIQDKDGNSYYLIRLRTQRDHLLNKRGELLPIIPGMTAEVDIITGKTTVLNYLLKPILRAWNRALREP